MSNPSAAYRARTKIVATVGPACGSVEKLLELIQAGASVFRINTAHGTQEEREKKLVDIRAASEQCGQPVGVLVDLAGPKIRLGELFADPTMCEVGEQFRFVPGLKSNAADELTSTYPTLIGVGSGRCGDAGRRHGQPGGRRERARTRPLPRDWRRA